MRVRRTGSVTLGITLIAIGLVYLVKVFYPAFMVLEVMRFWPVIFIILGIEILVTNRKIAHYNLPN